MYVVRLSRLWLRIQRNNSGSDGHRRAKNRETWIHGTLLQPNTCERLTRTSGETYVPARSRSCGTLVPKNGENASPRPVSSVASSTAGVPSTKPNLRLAFLGQHMPHPGSEIRPMQRAWQKTQSLTLLSTSNRDFSDPSTSGGSQKRSKSFPQGTDKRKEAFHAFFMRYTRTRQTKN